jgi:hypothetical protein
MTAADSVNEICTLQIELCDSDPLIWRQVEVPTSITLKALHDVIQAAMGWLDYHLSRAQRDSRVAGRLRSQHHRRGADQD